MNTPAKPRGFTACRCGKSRTYGYSLFKWIEEKELWKRCGESLHCGDILHRALKHKTVLITCNGCGAELLREMPPTRKTTPTGTEARVCKDIATRQAKGIAKYGTTVANNPLELRQWLQHAYEECLDQAVYLKRAIEEMEENTTTP